jgi:TonB family protein
LELLKITPELDLEPRSRASNGQLGLWDRLETPNQPIDVNLLIELEPEASRWRLRTVFLLSILGHLVLLALLYGTSGYIRHQQELAALEAENKPPEPMFLYMPPDLLKKLQQKPKTPILSDKDRLAQGKAPLVVPRAPEAPYSKGNTKLPEIAGGQPKVAAPPSPPPQPKPQAKTDEGKEQASSAPKQSDNALKLEDVPKPPSSPGHLALATPEEAIQQSLRDAARASRAQGRVPGPGDSLGQFSNPNSSFSLEGPMILSDTQGVDFGPYLARIVEVVRQNWYHLMPESARLGQKGRVAWQFAIQKDGRVPEVDPVVSSGSNALDGAAKAAIDLSIPFPPLPEEFKGNELKLRFVFLYNLGYGPQ